MKNYLFFLILTSVIISHFSCNNKDIDDISNNVFDTEPINNKTPNNVADWIQKGDVVYSIVYAEVSIEHTIAYPMKVKIISINGNTIKVKALNSINISSTKECDSGQISYGETWWEKDGDIFKNQDEAISKINSKKWILFE